MTQRPIPGLDEVIKSLSEPDDLPLPLPVTHVSIARWFTSIVAKGCLEPRMCSVFQEDLLYLFYGGVYYRTKHNPTRNASELPIAFLFDPSVLTSVNRYYPFDTGAMASGRYSDWGTRFSSYKDAFKVSGDRDYSVPCKMVYHIFGSNDGYLHGWLNPECKNKPEPLPQLFEFLSSDLSPHGVDQRQSVIECQTTDLLRLERHLLWIGFPESMTDIFSQLYQITKPHIPDYYAYDSHVIFNPAEIAAQLQLKASDIVRRFKQLPSGN